jgi:hypothetical protein
MDASDSLEVGVGTWTTVVGAKSGTEEVAALGEDMTGSDAALGLHATTIKSATSNPTKRSGCFEFMSPRGHLWKDRVERAESAARLMPSTALAGPHYLVVVPKANVDDGSWIPGTIYAISHDEVPVQVHSQANAVGRIHTTFLVDSIQSILVVLVHRDV